MEVKFVDKWNVYLEKFESSKSDIYLCEEYVKLYETSEQVAKCVVCEEEDRVILMPFLMSKIENYYDFETAYGYGGPVSNCDIEEWNFEALEKISEFLKDNNYLCGFIRFHTLLKNDIFCRKSMQVLFDRKTVSIDTSKSEEEIWQNQIISKNRNMIRKAEKNGLSYKVEYDFASMDEFISLYRSTMDRLRADEFYFFDEKYFRYFKEKFAGKAFLGTVRKDNELICAALFMFSEKYGHYHLEGSNHEYSSMGANNYLLWMTALEFNRLGVQNFHLGGGYDSTEYNSLFKFKKAFSSNLNDFMIGKWIFNPDKYTEIKEKWMRENPEKVEKLGKLLLCYRY